jgi:hypothetical protein
MGSKSENCEIHADDIEAGNKIGQDLLGLARSIDSKYVIRIIVGRWGEEMSAKRSNGWSAAIHFWRYREDCRLTLRIKRELRRKYIHRIEESKRDHGCFGKVRGYGCEGRRRRVPQFWEIENLSLRGRRSCLWLVQSLQKWIEWLWSTNMIAEMLFIYLGEAGRDPLHNQLFPFRDFSSVLSHSLESVARRFTSNYLPRNGNFMVRPYLVMGTLCKSGLIHHLAGSPSIALANRGSSQKAWPLSRAYLRFCLLNFGTWHRYVGSSYTLWGLVSFSWSGEFWSGQRQFCRKSWSRFLADKSPAQKVKR